MPNLEILIHGEVLSVILEENDQKDNTRTPNNPREDSQTKNRKENIKRII